MQYAYKNSVTFSHLTKRPYVTSRASLTSIPLDSDGSHAHAANNDREFA